MLMTEFMSTYCEFALRWMSKNIFDDKSALAQVLLGVVRQQTITRTNVDLDLLASLGLITL